MTACHIDHLTITAPRLEAGADFVSRTLGVRPQPGGTHPRMGTHNLLLRLGEALFLEVISINPEAPPPARARWFGLDRLPPDAPPHLATWVARSTDIAATLARATEPPGIIEPMSRGTLNWHITIPADGSLPLGGVAPALIQWESGAHPAENLQDFGLSLLRLELCHPAPERVTALLESLECSGPIVVSPLPAHAPPCLIAHIDTPAGPRTLSAPGWPR